jgi:SAM-dependent methyltransferase
MIERVMQRARAEGVAQIEARVANVYDLPFEAGTFDAVYLITVISEIPEPARALREFYRVLSQRGRWPSVNADRSRLSAGAHSSASATAANFRLKVKIGNFFAYTWCLRSNHTTAQPPRCVGPLTMRNRYLLRSPLIVLLRFCPQPPLIPDRSRQRQFPHTPSDNLSSLFAAGIIFFLNGSPRLPAFHSLDGSGVHTFCWNIRASVRSRWLNLNGARQFANAVEGETRR